MAFKRQARTALAMDPFTDLLFNVLLVFTFLFMVAIIFLNPTSKDGNVELKAEYIITVKWPDQSPDDVDTWVEDPQGHLVWFNNNEAGFMHLDRDDRGTSNDTIMVDGKAVVNPLNQEIVTLRKPIPGEYTVNLHYYKSNTKQPVTAEVTVSKVNPWLEIVYYGEVLLEATNSERTAVRFSVKEDGSVGEINTLPKSLVTVEPI